MGYWASRIASPVVPSQDIAKDDIANEFGRQRGVRTKSSFCMAQETAIQRHRGTARFSSTEIGSLFRVVQIYSDTVYKVRTMSGNDTIENMGN